MLLLYVCPEFWLCDSWVAVGLRYPGGAVLVTLEPVAGFTALPFEVLFVVLLTFVAVVLLVVVLLTVAPLVPLPVLGEVATVGVLRLTLLLTLEPPLSELPPPAASLSEPV